MRKVEVKNNKYTLLCWITVMLLSCTRNFDNPYDINQVFQGPSQLSVTMKSNDEMVLIWKDNSDFEDGFVIEKSTNNSSYQPLFVAGANDSIYIDRINPFDEGKRLFYRIKAVKGERGSEYSDVQSRYILFMPTNLILTVNLQTDTATLCWKDNSGLEDGFVIQSGTSQNLLTKIGQTNSNDTVFRFSIAHLDTINSHYCKVITVHGGIDSVFSQPISFSYGTSKVSNNNTAWSFYHKGIFAVEFSSDEKTIYATSSDSTISLDINTGGVVSTDPLKKKILTPIMSTYLLNSDSSIYVTFKVSTFKVQVRDQAGSLTWRDSSTCQLQAISTSTNAPIWTNTISGGTYLRFGHFSPSDNSLIIAFNDSTLKCFDGNSGIMRWSKKNVSMVFQAQFNPGEQTIATGTQDSTLSVLGANNGDSLWEKRLNYPIDNIRFSPDGATLAVLFKGLVRSDTTYQSKIELFRSESGNLISSCSGYNISDFDFNKNSSQIALAICDNFTYEPIYHISVIDVQSGTEIWKSTSMGGYNGASCVSMVRFSPGGNMVVSVAGSLVNLWYLKWRISGE